MAVKTGYTTGELGTLRERIARRADALIADLPREPLWQLNLTCTCDRCIDPDVLPVLCKTAPPHMTDRMISQYFGGVTASLTDQTEASQYEARVILTHVMAHLGRMIILPREAAREMSVRLSYVDADYMIPGLFKTDFLPQVPVATKADMRSYLLDVAHYAIAAKTTRLDDVLCYLALFTDALPEFIDTYRTGPPRRHLRFWTSIAGGSVSNDRTGVRGGKDFHLFYSGMPRADRERLLAALEAPEVPLLIERYAFQARDPQWLQYLSNLLEWREATILATKFSDRKDREA